MDADYEVKPKSRMSPDKRLCGPEPGGGAQESCIPATNGCKEYDFKRSDHTPLSRVSKDDLLEPGDMMVKWSLQKQAPANNQNQ